MLSGSTIKDIVQKSQRDSVAVTLVLLFMLFYFTFLMFQDAFFYSLSVSRACFGQSFGGLTLVERPVLISLLLLVYNLYSLEVVPDSFPPECTLSAVS